MTLDLRSVTKILERTPPVLDAVLGNLPRDWLGIREEEGTWSPLDVARHLADLERDAWLPRVRVILEHGRRRTLPRVDRERFRETFDDAPLESVLDAFRAARATNLEELAALELDRATLETPGRHPELGEVRLSELLAAWAVHDFTHLRQITRVLSSRYRAEVGPWASYLPILRSPGPEGPVAGRGER